MATSMKSSRLNFLAFAVGMTLTCSLLHAQIAGNGTVQGTISDLTAAIIPGATVTAKNVANGDVRTTQSTTAGLYVLAALPAGEYTVTFSAGGFETLVQERVIVSGLSVVSMNVTLKVGLATQQVEVTAAAAQLETSNSAQGFTVENRAYSALPLAMSGGPRSPEGFIALLPGISGTSSGSLGSFGAYTINGGEQYAKEIYVNGVPLTTSRLQGDNRNLTVSVEAIEQFQVLINGTPANYQGQGTENFVLKSGTNRFHGGLFEYIRNNAFDARGFFATSVPVQKQNEFGGTIGGPILKNRLFFFGTYGGYRIRRANSSALTSIPTEAQRNGDFSQVPVAIYDPNTTVCGGAGTCTRQPFGNNLIPQNRISGISKFLQSKLPATQNTSLLNNFSNIDAPGPGNNQNGVTAKIDYTVSDKNRLFGLMTFSKYAPTSLGGNLPLPYTSGRFLSITTTLFQLQDTHVISPNLLNVFSFGFNRFYPPADDPTMDGKWATSAGITGLPAGQASDAFPPVAFAGPNAPASWHANSSSVSYLQIGNSYVFGDHVSWVRGKHSLGFGFNLHLWQDNINNPLTGSALGGPTGPSSVGATPGGFSFRNTQTAGFSPAGALLATTGNAYASYLLGAVDTAGLQDNAAGTTGGRYRQYALFIQDDYKMTRRLTLNLGLRWELPKPYVEVADRLSFLDTSLPNPAASGYLGALQFAGKGSNTCNCRSPFKTHYTNFGPRIGFAYSLNDKTVIRSAFSIMYINAGALGGTGVTQATGILGYLANPTYTSLDAGITPAFNWNNGFPAYPKPPFLNSSLNTGFTTANPSGGFVTYGDPELSGKAPYMQNWHFTIQRELSKTTVLSVAYAGSKGTFLPTGIGRGIYSNQIDPKYLALGALLRANATPANIASANAITPGVKLPYANFQGTIGQMLRPFPQYAGVIDIYSDIANSTYHSLQASAQRRFTRGFSFLVSYTLSKQLDNAGDNTSGGATAGRTAYNNRLEKAVGAQSVPHQLVMSWVYELPFGRGHKLSGGNKFLQQVVSDWRVSGIQSYIQGRPAGTVTATCDVPNVGGCYADYNPGFTGNIRINGEFGDGNLIGSNTTTFLDRNAFLNPSSFTIGNTPRTLAFNLRQNPTLNEDFSVTRQFRVKEDMSFDIRVDSFNALNRVRFGNPAIGIASVNFGKVTSQANSGRGLQFAARFTF